MTSQTEEDKLKNGFSAQLRYKCLRSLSNSKYLTNLVNMFYICNLDILPYYQLPILFMAITRKVNSSESTNNSNFYHNLRCLNGTRLFFRYMYFNGIDSMRLDYCDFKKKRECDWEVTIFVLTYLLMKLSSIPSNVQLLPKYVLNSQLWSVPTVQASSAFVLPLKWSFLYVIQGLKFINKCYGW